MDAPVQYNYYKLPFCKHGKLVYNIIYKTDGYYWWAYIIHAGWIKIPKYGKIISPTITQITEGEAFVELL